MEQLYELVSQRFDRVQQVIKGPITSQRFRILKEQQKMRCEKQNFIISMMRANKTIQIISKSLYFRTSYEIMKKINPDFKHEMSFQRLQDHFLNDFVALYRNFFYKYEEMFSFKLKIQNLIRPTNHNLIIDLVKYLLDFSRDYYQQTFFWYMKSLSKSEKVQDQFIKDLDLSQQDKQENKKVGRSSINDAILQKLISKKVQENQSTLKRDSFKSYQILDIAQMPSVASQYKDPINTNIQALKIRINQIYRQMKSRNLAAKTNIANYVNRYFGQKIQTKTKEYQETEDEMLSKAIHPFKMALVIEKNGFNYISVTLSQNRYYSKPKDKKLSPLKVSQRIIPNNIQNRPRYEYMLTSLKIIRISQNFLPPLPTSQPNIINTANITVNLPFIDNNSRLNLLSSSSAANQEELSRKAKKQSFHQGTQMNINTNQPFIVKQKSIRKFSQIKKSFKSEQKRQGGILPIANSIINREDPQKKIYDWLEKLRLIKEIQRKKIMGLS